MNRVKIRAGKEQRLMNQTNAPFRFKKNNKKHIKSTTVVRQVDQFKQYTATNIQHTSLLDLQGWLCPQIAWSTNITKNTNDHRAKKKKKTKPKIYDITTNTDKLLSSKNRVAENKHQQIISPKQNIKHKQIGQNTKE